MLYFIVNPVSGAGKGEKAYYLLKDYLEQKGIPCLFHLTERRGHAEELATTLIAQGATRLYVVGGDGTINEVVNGIPKGRTAELAIIPAGTGNDFARPLGIPLQPIEALEFALNTDAKPTDVMLADGRRVMCFATSGIDIGIVQRCNALKKKSPSSYYRILLSELLHNRKYRFRITHDSTHQEVTAFIVAAVNNGQIATGMVLCPTASVEDGLLDIVIIERVPLLKQLRILKNLYNGKLLSLSGVRHIRTDSITVTLLTTPVIDLDGELRDCNSTELSVDKDAGISVVR